MVVLLPTRLLVREQGTTIGARGGFVQDVDRYLAIPLRRDDHLLVVHSRLVFVEDTFVTQVVSIAKRFELPG